MGNLYYMQGYGKCEFRSRRKPQTMSGMFWQQTKYVLEMRRNGEEKIEDEYCSKNDIMNRGDRAFLTHGQTTKPDMN